MLMVPVILAIFFFVIQMSLYFSAVHYANYATFVTARSLMANYGTTDYKSPLRNAEDIAELVLTGHVYTGNIDVVEQLKNNKAVGVQIQIKAWRTRFPFLSVLLPNMPFATTVNLGRREADYELVKSQPCTDNDVQSTVNCK
jgi:hypothetical protein